MGPGLRAPARIGIDESREAGGPRPDRHSKIAKAHVAVVIRCILDVIQRFEAHRSNRGVR